MCACATYPNTQTADPEMVFEWRAEAERRMRESGRPGMSEAQVRDFCSRYMPAYRAYLPGLYGSMGDRQQQRPVEEGAGSDEQNSRFGESSVEDVMVIEVGRDRNPCT